MKKCSLSLFFLSLSVLANPESQITPHSSSQKLQQIQRQEQLDWLSKAKYQEEKTEKVLTDLSQQCLPFESLEIIGATLVNTEAFAPQKGECLNEERLNKLSRDLTAAYLTKGYIHNPFRFENDQSGVLRLVITEGKVTSLTTQSPRLNLAMLFPNLMNKPLNVRDLDQGLEQANRMPNADVSVDVLPKKNGNIDLLFTNIAQRPVKNVLYLDNQASELYGDWQMKYQLLLANPLSLSDSLTLSLSSSLKHQKNHSYSFGLFHRVPYGNWTFNSFVYLSQSKSLVQLPYNQIERKSKNWQGAFKVDYVFHRGSNHISTLSGQIERIVNRSEFGGAVLELQSPKLTTAQLQLNHLQRLKNGSLILNLSYERGLNWGVQKLGDEAPRSDYSVWQANLLWQHLHQFNQQLFMFSHDVSGQYSQHYLYGVKQSELLGENKVRGFKMLSLNAEQQLLIQNQLSWLNQFEQSSIEPYLGFDFGVQKNSTGKKDLRKAIGYGVGVKFKLNQFYTDLSLFEGRLISDSANMNKRRERSVSVYAQFIF